MIGLISASNQFRTSSELAPNMFGASSELASVMEFGFYTHDARVDASLRVAFVSDSLPHDASSSHAMLPMNQARVVYTGHAR